MELFFESVDPDIYNFILETWNLDELYGLVDGSGICLEDELFIK